MKEHNGYTSFLCFCGALAFGWMVWTAPTIPWHGVAPLLLLIVILDMFPIRLISGDYFSAGTAGFLILLLAYGLEPSLLGIFASTTTFFIKLYRNPFRIRWFRFFCTAGMYCLSAGAAYQLMRVGGFAEASEYVKVLASASAFEVANAVLMAGIMKSTAGLPMLHKWKVKVKEVSAAVLLTGIIVPHLIAPGDLAEMYHEILIGLFYMAVILLFSRAFIHEAGLRQQAAMEFIRLFESRIHPQMVGHGTRVGHICELLLETVDFPVRQRKELIQAAIMHDIGKAVLMPHLFNKRGPLTLKEEAEYQTHAEKGAEITQTFYAKSRSSQWILHHHERYDGKGYPYGLAGTDIPLGARVIALCNRVEHLIAEGKDDPTVLALLAAASGKEFDPTLIRKVTPTFLGEARELVSCDASKQPERMTEPEATAEANQHTHDSGNTTMLRYRMSTERFVLPPPFVESDAACEELKRLTRRAGERHQTFHELIETGGNVYDAHFFPEDDEVRIFLVDVTPTLQYKTKLFSDALKAYKDVISALSQQKVRLCLRPGELDERLGEHLGSMAIQTKSDIAKSRDYVASFANYDVKRGMNLKLAVSETATNLIKHAGEGTLSVYRKDDALQVLVSDRGSGIPLHELPKTVLLSGYSSKSSLGKGFSIIYRMCDEVSIYTSTNGTSLLLSFHADEGADAPSPRPITA
ncbi:HD domain-containing phosphohydrolase [Paenibacillus sp.]|uniref:HD domain-containing phosphohydrolase n=1 Tax=Paenibacillus sp. TaxID=58172 RepID=UPI0028125E98|nr:HD domain-containing phosphohydrolase [Paenibacillus sp.]